MWPQASRAQAQKLGGWRSVPPCARPRERAWVESGELCPQGRCSRGGWGRRALSEGVSVGSGLCPQAGAAGRAWAGGSVLALEPRMPPAVTGCSGQRVLTSLPGGARARTSKSPVAQGATPEALLNLVYVLRWRGARVINAATSLGKLLFETASLLCSALSLGRRVLVSWFSPKGRPGRPSWVLRALQARQPAMASIAGAA